MGSFIPPKNAEVFKLMQALLQDLVLNLMGRNQLNYFSHQSPAGLQVEPAGGTLSTCYRYDVIDQNKNQLLIVKIYDKMLDLVGREGCTFIGTNLPKLIGSTNHIDAFQQKLRKAKLKGMTRLEVSFNFNELA